MPTLLMRLSAPMQAWGTQSRFEHKDTGREPSKSGVVGLLCSALGVPRTDTEMVKTLAQLRMGTRADLPGRIMRDYHTAGMGGIYRVGGGTSHSLMPSERFYLADAKFLVALEGDRTLLEQLQTALQAPHWMLALGRKAFIPSERVWLADGLVDADLQSCLQTYSWLASGGHRKPPETLQIVVDSDNGGATRNDMPISFEPRRFISRRVRIGYVPTPLPEGNHEEDV